MKKLTFLGTGTSQGVPVISCECDVCKSTDSKDKRLRASVLIEYNGVNILIDCGPDFRQQMLRENVMRLDAILLTHDHKDHIAGIDDVRAFNYTSGKAVDIYAEERVQLSIKREFSYAFGENRYPGVPDISLISIDETPFEVCDVKVIPIRGKHYKLPVLGFAIGNMCYITDINHIEESEIEKIKGIDTLVINALRKEKHMSHLCLNEALDIIKKISPRVAYLTHVSHQMGFFEIEEKLLPDNVHFAYDGLNINI